MIRYFKLRPFHTLRWFFLKYFTTRRYIISPVNNRKMMLDLRVGGISRALTLYGTREEDMLKIIRDEVKPDMHILDLGANLGYYTLEFSSLISDRGRIIAIEPDPRNFAVLQKNVEGRRFKNIIIQCLAASDVKGNGQMAITDKSNLNTLVVTEGHAQCELLNVKTETISNIARTYLDNRLDFIRMDIEGYEYEAIKGLIDYLDTGNNKPIILFEVHPAAYGNERDMRGLLQILTNSYNYTINTVVSTNGGKEFFDGAGIAPDKEMYSDGFFRYFYSNLPNELAIDAIVKNPKCIRYALLK